MNIAHPLPASPAAGGGAAAPPPLLPPGFVLVVAGGRQFRGLWAIAALRQALGALPRPSVVFHGGCSGADVSAGSWAFTAGLPVVPFPAPWSTFGRAAGPMRNQHMLAVALARGVGVLLVAFPGGPGTRNVVSLAHAMGIRVWQPLAGR
jgi:hypothetical protein